MAQLSYAQFHAILFALFFWGHGRRTVQSAQALAQDLDVRETEWYYAYRQVVFKLLEHAEDDKATGLGHVKIRREVRPRIV